MLHKIKAIFIDLDGTLIHHGKISQKNIQACNDLQARNIKVIVTTGRDFTSTQKYLKILKINNNDGYCICLCGAAIYDLSTGRVILKTAIKHKILVNFLADITQKKMSASLCTFDNIFLHNATSRLHKKLNRYYSHSNLAISQLNFDQFQLDNSSEIFKLNIYKLTAIIKPQQFVEKLKYLQEKYHDSLNFYSSSVFSCEVLDASVNKGAGIEFVCQKLNLNMDQVAFIGNGTNDIPAFQKVTYKAAVANAVPELIKLASHWTLSCKKDGFAYFVNNQILPKNDAEISIKSTPKS